MWTCRGAAPRGRRGAREFPGSGPFSAAFRAAQRTVGALPVVPHGEWAPPLERALARWRHSGALDPALCAAIRWPGAAGEVVRRPGAPAGDLILEPLYVLEPPPPPPQNAHGMRALRKRVQHDSRKQAFALSVLTLQCMRYAAGQGAAAAPRRHFVDLGARMPPAPGARVPDWAEVLSTNDAGLANLSAAAEALSYPYPFTDLHAFELSPSFAAKWGSVNGTVRNGTRVHFHHAAASVADGMVNTSYNAFAGAKDHYTMERIVNPSDCHDLRTGHARWRARCKRTCAWIVHNCGPNAPLRAKNQVSRRCKGYHHMQSVDCISVEARDTARWIRRTLPRDDWVVLKMDVEGFEYALIPHLFDTGVLQTHVDELFVEFHDFVTEGDGATPAYACGDRACSTAVLLALRNAGVAAHWWI